MAIMRPREFAGLDPLVHSYAWVQADRRAGRRLMAECPPGMIYFLDFSRLIHESLICEAR